MAKDVEVEFSREKFAAFVGGQPGITPAANYFLSRAWASEYLVRWRDRDFFVGMRLSCQVPGTRETDEALVYFSRGTRSSPLSLGHRSLGFNESSDEALESVTVEMNGLIGATRMSLSAWMVPILERLLTIPDWDEIRINALPENEATELSIVAVRLGLMAHVYSVRKTYLVDYLLVRERFAGDYLASRSPNTRQQVRRAERGIEKEHGQLNVLRASTISESHQWLDSLAVLHLKRWGSPDKNDGFANPGFSHFHHSLLETMIPAGTLDILKICAGSETVAYLHNFVIDGRVYFNMSGIDYERFSHHRPGILAHYIAIIHYQGRGMQIYDFLAGTNRYKQSLASHQEVQTSLVLRKPLLRFRLEAILRRLKRSRKFQAK